jgi:N-acetylglutamate synthase and related acetyltransferases
MVQVKIVNDSINLKEIFHIWESVFGNSSTNYTYNSSNIYIILYEGLKEDKPIGAALIRSEGEECHIENLAVIENKRNQQNGEFLLRFAVDKGFQLECKKVIAVTNLHSGDLFKKIGFLKTYDDKIQQNMIKYEIIPENFYKRCKH